MPISFNCEHCGKKVKAPDKADGKQGNCPFCHKSCYIPLPEVEDDDELKLAPIDETEEQKYKQMMADTHQLTQNILHEKEQPPETPANEPKAQTSEDELKKNLIIYLKQLANGQLDDAEKMAEKIIPYRRQGIKILDKMAKAKTPEPELANVAPKLLAGLMKNLRMRMG